MGKRRYAYTEMEHLIGEYITGPKSERNREILRQYFLRGLTQAEIAESVDMSVIQVGRIIRDEGGYLMTMLK